MHGAGSWPAPLHYGEAVTAYRLAAFFEAFLRVVLRAAVFFVPFFELRFALFLVAIQPPD